MVGRGRVNLTAGLRVGHPAAHDANLVIDWLDSSCYLLDVQKAEKTAISFARIFSRSTVELHSELVQNLHTVKREVLRNSFLRVG